MPCYGRDGILRADSIAAAARAEVAGCAGCVFQMKGATCCECRICVSSGNREGPRKVARAEDRDGTEGNQHASPIWRPGVHARTLPRAVGDKLGEELELGGGPDEFARCGLGRQESRVWRTRGCLRPNRRIADIHQARGGVTLRNWSARSCTEPTRCRRPREAIASARDTSSNRSVVGVRPARWPRCQPARRRFAREAPE